MQEQNGPLMPAFQLFVCGKASFALFAVAYKCCEKQRTHVAEKEERQEEREAAPHP